MRHTTITITKEMLDDKEKLANVLNENFTAINNKIQVLLNNVGDLQSRADIAEANASIINHNVNLIISHMGIKGGKHIIKPNSL